MAYNSGLTFGLGVKIENPCAFACCAVSLETTAE